MPIPDSIPDIQIINELDTKDERLVDFYWRKLGPFLEGLNYGPHTSTSEKLLKIKEIVLNNSQDNNHAKCWIDSLKNDSNLALIPKEHFNWIDAHNPRVCIWLAHRVAMHFSITTNQIPISSKEQISFIIKCFDNTEPAVNKIDLIFDFKADWQMIYNKTSTFQWLSEENIDQCKWASQYIINKNFYHFYAHPSSESELYNSIVANYDLWTAHEDTKFRFLDNMKKSWNKRKHIASLKEKDLKQCTFIISQHCKDTLKTMAEQQGITQNALIEKLIYKEAQI